MQTPQKDDFKGKAVKFSCKLNFPSYIVTIDKKPYTYT